MPKALVFPHTQLRRAMKGGLLPWFESLVFLKPTSLKEDIFPKDMIALNLIQTLDAHTEEKDSDVSFQTLQKALREFEIWVATQRGAGRLDSLKAGVEPSSKPTETLRSLMKDIKDPDRSPSLQKEFAPLPEIAPGLMLHLAHIWESQAQEMDNLVAMVEQGKDRLGRAIGEDGELTDEFSNAYDIPLTPSDHEAHDEKLLEQRLKAWSSLVLELEPKDCLLATANLPCAKFLLEKANQSLYGSGTEKRSQAGSSLLADFSPLGFEKDSLLAREVFRIALPQIAGFTQDAYLQAHKAFEQVEALVKNRVEFESVLGDLTNEKWSRELAVRVSEKARDLSKTMLYIMDQAKVKVSMSKVNISVLVFPRLSQMELLKLMQNPNGYPVKRDQEKGSGVVIVVWPMDD